MVLAMCDERNDALPTFKTPLTVVPSPVVPSPSAADLKGYADLAERVAKDAGR